jgi:uncharacterized membrane protein YdjX (TVP38/TMEM64 family)
MSFKNTTADFIRNHNNIVKVISLFLAILISVLIYIFRDKLSIPKNWGYLGIFLVSILSNATIFFPVPTLLTALLVGNLLNPILVGIVLAFGAAIGEITSYLAGRGGSIIIHHQKIFKIIENMMNKYGLWTIFVLAIIPNPFFDLAGIVAGITEIPFWKYFLVTWTGKTIKFILFSLLGTYTLINIRR